MNKDIREGREERGPWKKRRKKEEITERYERLKSNFSLWSGNEWLPLVWLCIDKWTRYMRSICGYVLFPAVEG